MPTHEEALLVPYTPEEMFDLVADVERYPEFVPGWSEARVDQRQEHGVVAWQRIGIGAVAIGFHSVATFDRPRSIQIRSAESPFDAMEIEWRFEPAAGGCRITFAARARLSDSLTGRLLQPWLDRLGDFVPSAFVKRARALYGPRHS